MHIVCYDYLKFSNLTAAIESDEKAAVAVIAFFVDFCTQEDERLSCFNQEFGELIKLKNNYKKGEVTEYRAVFR